MCRGGGTQEKSGGLRELSSIFRVVAVDCHSVFFLSAVVSRFSYNAGLCALWIPFQPVSLFLPLIQQVNHNTAAVPILLFQNVIFSFETNALGTGP